MGHGSERVKGLGHSGGVGCFDNERNRARERG